VNNTQWKYVSYVIVAIALIYLINFGYRWSLTRKNVAAAVVTDHDLQKDVEGALASSDTYAHEKISVAVHNGEAILTGMVHEQWKQEGAGSIASAVPGIVSVKNSIQVREVQQQQQAPWTAATTESAPETPAVKRARAVQESPEAKAQAFIDDGNAQIKSKNYDAAIKDFQAALALQPGNYEAQSGLQEAKTMR